MNNSGVFLLIIIILIIGIVTFGIVSFSGEIDNSDKVMNGTFPEIKSSDRIIIISPHPDDGVLANSGIIKEALRKNAEIKVVYMTVGDALDKDYLKLYLRSKNINNFKGSIGDIRHLEALNGLVKLGLNESNAVFLGYPDQGLKSLFLSHWDYNNLLKKNSGSNQNDHSPYNFTFEKNAPYCGANVVKNLDQIFDDFNPNILLMPDDGDDHPDHWSANAFIQYVALEKGFNGSIYHYLVHKGIWPTPGKYSPDDQLLPPFEVVQLDAIWLRLKLNNKDKKLKLEAINSHETQTFATKNYLQSFDRVDEFFAIYPNIKVSKKEAYSISDGMPTSSFKDLTGESINIMENHIHHYNRIALKRNVSRHDFFMQSLIYDVLDSAGLVKDGQNLYAVINSNKYNVNFNYIFYLYLYNGSDYRKLDINVTNNTANYLYKSSDSILSSQKLEVEHANNLTSVKIPLSVIENTQNILMTVDEINGINSIVLDSTPLRVFQL
ncbi:MAG: PIG-L family deacetylase [Methanobrevibacter sp.]|jgi:LmbE family N-acetylglucosaminyl deacetylase|nr:PIG-L family deacetylase [Candidatus Methanovirga basalitermitum]